MITTARPTRVRGATRTRLLAALAAAVLAAMAIAASAPAVGAEDTSELVYEAAPSFDKQANFPSQAWQYGLEQVGDHIQLAGDARVADTVSLWMNSWGCEAGQYSDGTCLTGPGATFSTDMTVRIYAVSGETVNLSYNGANATVPLAGAQIQEFTQSVTVPYRPSSDSATCDGKNFLNAESGTCENALPFEAVFDLSALDLVLPDEFIVAVDKPAPGTNADGKARSINVLNPGILSAEPADYPNYPVNPDFATTVGTNPAEDVVYVRATSEYGSDVGVNVFGPALWGLQYRWAISVTATSPAATSPAGAGEATTSSVELGDSEVTFDAMLGDDPSGELILSSSYTADPGDIGLVPPDTQTSFGAYSYTLNVVEGSTATVTIETETPANTLFKYMGGEWAEYPAEFSGTTITFELTDGGAGDLDGEVNGVIVDPVAPGLMASFTG